MKRDAANMCGLFLSVVIGLLVASSCDHTASSERELGELVELADRYGTDKASSLCKKRPLLPQILVPKTPNCANSGPNMVQMPKTHVMWNI